jgi:hypothetical protein
VIQAAILAQELYLLSALPVSEVSNSIRVLARAVSIIMMSQVHHVEIATVLVLLAVQGPQQVVSHVDLDFPWIPQPKRATLQQ